MSAQREVTRILLASVEGFALAGSGAIREHGFTDRPTEDIDLFTASLDLSSFSTAVDRMISSLRVRGFHVELIRRSPLFARVHVVIADKQEVDVDLGVDWRQCDPVHFAVGPVLSLVDAVGNKLSALYSRAEARDFLDVDAIRASSQFSDAELIAAAAERDAGFEVGMFTQQLAAAARLQPAQVARYGVTAEQLEAIKTRFADWSAELRAAP